MSDRKIDITVSESGMKIFHEAMRKAFNEYLVTGQATVPRGIYDEDLMNEMRAYPSNDWVPGMGILFHVRTAFFRPGYKHNNQPLRRFYAI